MAEEVKRLAPTYETLRELYLKSGNQCAFPGCHAVMFNHEGNFVGQICHIEAAETGGERFNPNQTNDQRRQFSNLMLMCYPHHVETNKVDVYDVESLQRMKADHEKKFYDVTAAMLQSITDHTTQVGTRYAENLERLNRVLGWGHDKEMLAENVQEFKERCESFSKIPQPAREFFCIMLKRSHPISVIGGSCSSEVSGPDIQQATGLDKAALGDFFSILDRNNLTHDNDVDDYGAPLIGIRSLKSGWSVWEDIKQFCAREGIDIAQVIIALDFSVLDE